MVPTPQITPIPTTRARRTSTALNYLALRYDRIYATTDEAHGRDSSLSGAEVRPSRLSGTRNIVDVIFSYTNRETGVTEKSFVRVEVT